MNFPVPSLTIPKVKTGVTNWFPTILISHMGNGNGQWEEGSTVRPFFPNESREATFKKHLSEAKDPEKDHYHSHQ